MSIKNFVSERAGLFRKGGLILGGLIGLIIVGKIFLGETDDEDFDDCIDEETNDDMIS